MARQASRSPARKKAAPKATVTQVLTTPGSGGQRAFVSRDTKETRIAAAVDLDGTGRHDIATGIGFLDHMLEQLARHSLIDLTLARQGRPAHRRPPHHRGHRHRARRVPRQGAGRPRRHPPLRRGPHPDGRDADRVALDVSGRPYLVWKVDFPKPKIGEMDTELFKEWFKAFAQNGGITLHVVELYGENSHHIVESCFKGLARALRAAVEIDPRQTAAVPSTKGVL